MGILDSLKENVMAIVMIVLLAASGAIALSSFQQSIEDSNPCVNSSEYWNETSNGCQMTNSSCGTYTTATLGCFLSGPRYGTNAQYNTTAGGLEGVSSGMDFMGTIGTLVGVGALIGIVMTALYFGTR